MTQAAACRFLVGSCLVLIGCLLLPSFAEARNISGFSDTISDSTPGDYSNHRIQFTIGGDIAPGGYIEFSPPPEFHIDATSTESATSTFTARNVELLVNNSPRSASSSGTATVDEVSITPGSPGSVRYTLNPTFGVFAGDVLTLLVGSNTSGSFNGEVSFSTSTGTSTAPQDIGIRNASTTGTHGFTLNISGGSVPMDADFKIALVDEVRIDDVDTTEQIPPFRFNGQPTGDVGGTTLAVELSLETDEFAACRFSTTASTSFFAMVDQFENTGGVVHSQEISGLANNTSYIYYVRCIDDEGNFNIDDFEISFNILDVPEGDPNTEGDVEGDGTGSGDEGSGTEADSGGVSGSDDGESNTEGESSGGGGSGGGGGGSRGREIDDEAGGGFESTDAPFRSGDGRVIIRGYAFPGSTVTILVDGQRAATTQANSDGEFSETIDDIARGVYTFGLYATDDNDVQSSVFSTSFSVQGARTSSLSNVNIMPSILVEPDPADLGETVTISGFSIPDANLFIENQKDDSAATLEEFTTTSDGDGAWSIEVDTDGFARGTYKVRARAVQEENDIETNFSDYTFYGVGEEAAVQINADLNRDGSVNLIDFSILLFWWGTEGGESDPPADINQDGNVSLTDFSILLFNWTG